MKQADRRLRNDRGGRDGQAVLKGETAVPAPNLEHIHDI